MQDLTNYTVGGTVHVIVNNQIGFTTVPSKGRSATYASDLAKAVGAPIFHVNADAMEEVHMVFKAAGEYRQKYKHDVVIDLIGYRKMGHNELDQPSFTQPLMYQQVAKMTPVARLYEAELVEGGHLTADEVAAMKEDAISQLEAAYAKSKTLTYKAEDWVTQEWAEIMEHDVKDAADTGLDAQRFRDLGSLITELPKDAEFHRLVKKIFEARTKSIQDGKDIDWGTAEALAFGSLIQDGYKVRVSG